MRRPVIIIVMASLLSWASIPPAVVSAVAGGECTGMIDFRSRLDDGNWKYWHIESEEAIDESGLLYTEIDILLEHNWGHSEGHWWLGVSWHEWEYLGGMYVEAVHNPGTWYPCGGGS